MWAVQPVQILMISSYVTVTLSSHILKHATIVTNSHILELSLWLLLLLLFLSLLLFTFDSTSLKKTVWKQDSWDDGQKNGVLEKRVMPKGQAQAPPQTFLPLIYQHVLVWSSRYRPFFIENSILLLKISFSVHSNIFLKLKLIHNSKARFYKEINKNNTVCWFVDLLAETDFQDPQRLEKNNAMRKETSCTNRRTWKV